MIAHDLLPPPAELTADKGRRLIDACLAEAQALRDLPGKITPLGDVPPEVLERAERLSHEWARWAEETGDVWERVKDLEALPIAQRRAFWMEYIRGRSHAERNLAQIRGNWEAEQAGDYKTGEELRRELGLPPRG